MQAAAAAAPATSPTTQSVYCLDLTAAHRLWPCTAQFPEHNSKACCPTIHALAVHDGSHVLRCVRRASIAFLLLLLLIFATGEPTTHTRPTTPVRLIVHNIPTPAVAAAAAKDALRLLPADAAGGPTAGGGL
jgi:hypothetical protein